MNLVLFQTVQAVQLFQNGPLPLHHGGELRVDLLQGHPELGGGALQKFLFLGGKSFVDEFEVLLGQNGVLLLFGEMADSY